MAFVNIVPQQLRGPVTNQRSPARTLTIAQGHTGQITFRFPMDVTSIQNPNISLTYQFQKSADGGASWGPWIGPETFVGSPTTVNKQGQTVANTVLPQCSGSIGPGNWQISLLFTIPVAFSVGLDVDQVVN